MWVIVGALLGLAAAQPVAGAPADSSVTFSSELALRSYLQGRLLETQGEVREALGEYVRAFSLDRKSVALCRRIAELLARMGDASSALEFADKALKLAPRDATSLWVKGASFLGLGRANEALATLEQAVDADSSRIDLLQTLARAAESLNRIDLVARAYERVVVIDPDEGENWFQLAAAQARLGRFEEADRSLERATDLSPMRPGQLFLGGWIDESLGRTPVAISKYRQHLRSHPADQVARRRLVNLLSRGNRWDEAYTEAGIVSASDPTDLEALEIELELGIKAGRRAEVRQSAERIRALVEADPERIGRLASVFARNGDPDEGVRIADAWAQRHSTDPRGPLLAARVRAVANRFAAAIPFARRAVEASPDSLGPRLLLARLYRDARRPTDAEQVLVELNRREPSNITVLLELAGLREDSGNSAGAEAAARDALRADPENPRIQNFLGYLLADHDKSLVEAERLITQAVTQDPDNGAYVDSMGWVFFRRGRLEEARGQLERAIELTGGDPLVREHLGDVYRALKLFEEARNQYRLSLAQDASNDRVRAKLSTLRR